ncbi:MAG: T9SS type A sorting domain-containing protein [Bacteroidales bacterium]|nr:T9SS type A sorting domain-containing protein [Bacteroidales bacterium]
MRKILTGLVFGLCLLSSSKGQQFNGSSDPWSAWKTVETQDTVYDTGFKGDNAFAEPDTNFTYEKYSDFLLRVSDTSRYVVLPLNEFRTTFDSRKVVIGLRHDVDIDLNKAFDFSASETELGFRSSYYILHTASYYLANASNMAVHSSRVLPVLKKMQDEGGHEIGWHNDLVTLQAVYNMNPAQFLSSELAWLRSNGINIYGTASHGSGYCYTFKYLNYYFFEECTWPVVGQFVNNLSLPINGKNVPMIKGKLADFGLDYEAYFLNNNKYFSDASITNNVRWSIGMLNLSQLTAGDRVIILLHPIHWHRASVLNDINLFFVPEQVSSVIDRNLRTVTVTVPASVNRSALVPSFTLSPGAYAKVNGSMQSSGSSAVDFTYPVTYSVFAENRKIISDWTVAVEYQSLSSDEVPPGTEESLVVYPNPSGGKFTLQFSNISASETEIAVFSQSGSKVFGTRTSRSGSFNELIDLSGFPRGTYILRYSGSKERAVLLVIN